MHADAARGNKLAIGDGNVGLSARDSWLRVGTAEGRNALHLAIPGISNEIRSRWGDAKDKCQERERTRNRTKDKDRDGPGLQAITTFGRYGRPLIDDLL